MKLIDPDTALHVFLDSFPEFRVVWEGYLQEWGNDNGWTINVFPFIWFSVDTIEKRDLKKVARIFDCVEKFISDGDEVLSTAFTTGYWEGLLNAQPDEIGFVNVAHLMGPRSKAYCRDWDRFTGVRTRGLWES